MSVHLACGLCIFLSSSSVYLRLLKGEQGTYSKYYGQKKHSYSGLNELVRYTEPVESLVTLLFFFPFRSVLDLFNPWSAWFSWLLSNRHYHRHDRLYHHSREPGEWVSVHFFRLCFLSPKEFAFVLDIMPVRMDNE